MAHIMFTEGGASFDSLIEESRFFASTDLMDTIYNNGTMTALHASRHVFETMLSEGCDHSTIAYAFEKPWKYPEYWIPALFIHGDLYYGNGTKVNMYVKSDVTYDGDTFRVDSSDVVEVEA